jgi:hypothetical protein
MILYLFGLAPRCHRFSRIGSVFNQSGEFANSIPPFARHISCACARHIPGAEVRVVASAWGHMALMNPADIPAIDAPLNELLAD